RRSGRAGAADQDEDREDNVGGRNASERRHDDRLRVALSWQSRPSWERTIAAPQPACIEQLFGCTSRYVDVYCATRRLHMTTMVTDRIEKQVALRAPRSRVWRALTDAKEFGSWCGVKFEAPFTEGATVRGQITYPGYEHLTMDVVVERIEPERYFAFRWHPYAIDTKTDYSHEPMTLVEFRLEKAGDGTV